MNIRTLMNYVATGEAAVVVTGELVPVYNENNSIAFHAIELFVRFPYGHFENDGYYSYSLEEFLELLESYDNRNLSCVYLLGYTQVINGFLPQLVEYAEENGLEIAIAEKVIAMIMAILEREDC